MVFKAHTCELVALVMIIHRFAVQPIFGHIYAQSGKISAGAKLCASFLVRPVHKNYVQDVAN